MSIIEDKRAIVCLYLTNEESIRAIDGNSIEAYHENGKMAPIVWFKLINERGDVLSRINSKFVGQVFY